MKLAIIGSRSFTNFEYLSSILTEYASEISEIISGGATGADNLAEQWAKAHNIPITVYPADWTRYGRSAGPRRNHDIIINCDKCIAFWDGESNGTGHAIGLCTKYKKPVHIITYV
jgi:hypothetical protein